MEKMSLVQNNRRNIKRKSKMILIYVTISFSVLLIYLLISFYYNNHFFKNTMINGVKTSNMTVDQVEEAINAQIKTYTLTLNERNDKSEQISGGDINLHVDFNGSIKKLLEQQNGFLWPISLNKANELEVSTMFEYDESLLKQVFRELESLKEENNIKPKDAYISKYTKNGYEIIPEDPGSKVKEDVLYEEINKAISSLETSLSLEEMNCYEEPKIKSDYAPLVKAVDEMNKIASAKITYEFGEDIEIVDGNRISEWISVDGDYKVNLDTESIKEFVDYIGRTYNTFGKERTLATSYGEVIQISGGDYGWWLNRGKEVTELTELILDGKQVVKEPAYYQTANQYGEDDIGDTYVEVNITAQHLFFYKEGKLILETDFVSGNLSKNYINPTGTFPVQYKENDATLKGEDYATPVKYWMPFNGNIGFHDAPWRDSFGGDIYLKNGSHGCINMPPAAAKIMFENIQRGVAVFVYELEGTENYDIKDEIKDDIKDVAPNNLR